MVALRLRPVAAQGIQRDVPPEGIVVAGKFIPGGVLLSFPLHANLDQCLCPYVGTCARSKILFQSSKIHPRKMD